MTRLQERLFQQVLSQEIGFFDQRRTGELLNRLTSDATVLQKAVTVNVSMGLRFALSGVGAIAILIWTSWKLALLMLAVVPVIAIGAGWYGRILRKISRSVQDAFAELVDLKASEVFERFDLLHVGRTSTGAIGLGLRQLFGGILAG